MAVEIRFSVMSPEAQVKKLNPWEFPPGFGGPPQDTGRPAESSATFAKRLDTLDNKTIYLVDTGFGGSYRFMQQLQKWFSEHMPSVTTIRKRKPGNVFMDDNNELWDEVKARGDAIVLGVGG
ncbi:MAG: hypothetical protein JXA46_11185 [Dehalococcoidales bacterium]|nr:hypothetical protein [Dehalococcoidales bacterium]